MQQSKWVKKILKTIPKKRKFQQKPKQIRRNKVKSIIQRRHLTKQNIINVLNHYQIFTIKKLFQWNVRNPNRIPYCVIKQLFGSWANCKKHLNYDFSSRYKFDQQKVIQATSHFKITTLKQYRQANLLQPTIFPSYDWILKHFLKFDNFIRLVRANIVEDILTRFFKLKQQLKRYPTKGQCEKRKIQLDVLQQIWQPDELKQIMSYLEKQYAKQQRKLARKNKKANTVEIE